MTIFSGHFTKINSWWRNPQNGRDFVEKTSEILEDPIKKLTEDVNNIPSNPADVNILVSVSKDEYNKNKEFLDVMYQSCYILKTNVLSAVQFLENDDDYNSIMSIMSTLTSVTSNKEPVNSMDAKLDITKDMTNTEKLQFLGSTTESVFNMIQTMKYHQPDKPLLMPTSINKSIKNSLKRSKDEILVDKFGGFDVNKTTSTTENVNFIWNFNASADEFFGVYTTITPSGSDGLNVIHCDCNYDSYSYIYKLGLSFPGSANSMIKIKIKKVNDTNAPWVGYIYYRRAGLDWNDSYKLVIPEPTYDEDGWGIIECDMSKLTFGGPYGQDWMEQTITGIRFDFFRGAYTSYQEFLIDWIKISNPEDYSIEIDDRSLYTKIIQPIQEYQKYLDSNNISDMINKLINTELFLIPKYCTPENFLAGNTLLSKYYSNLYMIDPNGNMHLNKLSSDPTMISKLHNIISNLIEYYE